MIHNMVGGGGSSDLYAVIAITYPSGSICTCGGKAAKDTSGFALFNVKPGTYTVECHTSDNSQSNSTSVTVAESDKGKSVSVTLAYQTDYYNRGDQCTDVTGGWSKTGTGGSLTFNDASMTLVANSYQNGTDAATKNKVDLSGIKTLHIRIKSSTTYPTGYPRIGVSTKNNPVSSTASGWTASKTLTASSSLQTVSIDVTSLTGSYYIVFGGLNGDSGGATIEVESIWGVDK